MKFLDLNKADILQNSTLTEDGYYEYTIGNPIEVTSIRSQHVNSLMSMNLSDSVNIDKLMLKYQPTNKILFSKSFLDDELTDKYASCFIDGESNRVYVGTPTEFSEMSGLLVFSGYLSINCLVEKDRNIVCTDRYIRTIKDKVRVLSVGVRGDKLYALWYIPSTKGIAISTDKEGKGVSPTTYKICNCKNYMSYSIRDWFQSSKIKEL